MHKGGGGDRSEAEVLLIKDVGIGDGKKFIKLENILNFHKHYKQCYILQFDNQI